MRVLQVGNFGPEHSTENHLLRALRNNGHEVLTYQENDPATFSLLSASTFRGVDLILWTRTGWNWNQIYPGGEVMAHADQRRMLRRARKADVPVVGYHLDIWWGLRREYQIRTEPYFESELMVTADGGHDERWRQAGIDHVWFPPGVSRTECELGEFDYRFEAPLAFVGSWRPGYHPESQHRASLIEWLQTQHCVFYPRQGEPAVRGVALRNLYATVPVLIGDSCFTGTGLANYWSDRIPETLGRGGFLIHPYVPGLEEHFALERDLMVWQANNWDQLKRCIDWALNNPEETRAIAMRGRERVLRDHTYETRMEQLVDLLRDREML